MGGWWVAGGLVGLAGLVGWLVGLAGLVGWLAGLGKSGFDSLFGLFLYWFCNDFVSIVSSYEITL